MILTRDDVLSLRLSLLSVHVRPELPVWTTMFDATVTRELRRAVPTVNVLSPADLVAEELAAQCLAAGAEPVRRVRSGVRLVDDALRLLLGAGLGLLAALLVEAGSSMLAVHDDLLNALYFSTRSVATVAGAPGAARAPAWFKLVSTLDTIAAVLLLAVFTAALVRRLSRPAADRPVRRACSARGPARAARRLRAGRLPLAQRLRRSGIPVLALERDPGAPCLRLARDAGIPVSIGRGEDRATLQLLGIRRCAVVAAVTSTDLVNVEIVLAASDLAPSVPVVLRLGDGAVAAETDSLLHVGHICDAHAISRRWARAAPDRGHIGLVTRL